MLLPYNLRIAKGGNPFHMKDRFLVSFAILFGLGSCKHEPQETPAPSCSPVSFARDVKPIIEQNCAIYGCHVAGSPDGDFNQFPDLKEKVNNGSFKNSVIDWNAPRMPETYKLSEAQLRILQCWLNDNAPEN